MVKDYLKYYNIPENYSFKSGEFTAGNYSIWSWVLEPSSWKNTVVILHGFLDHSLSNRLIILHLLKRGFRVVGGDMPGHGRSSGVRGGIFTFNAYDTYFDALLDYWNIERDQTFVMGHSTGCSILINYSRRCKENFRGMILAAPLVKMNYQSQMKRGIDLTQDWIKDLPATKIKSSRNKAFLRFKWKDPLGVKRFSLDWIKSMVEWNRDWKVFPSTQPVLILQGKKDTVVEWKTNIPLLEKCYSDCRVLFYQKGRHHILNESDRIRKDVFRSILNFIEER
jgi:alpha-beta hydrolase superfamily lysophospholipase